MFPLRERLRGCSLGAVVVSALVIGGAGVERDETAQPERLPATSGAEPGPALLIDAHIDAPMHAKADPFSFRDQPSHRDFDLTRARAGGLNAAFFPVFIPNGYNQPGTWRRARGGAFAEALRRLSQTRKALARDNALAEIVTAPDQLTRTVRSGKLAVILALENGSPIEGDTGKLRQLFAEGVRYVTLTHGKDNHIADSSYDSRHSHRGLTPFGKQLIREMNCLGMMIDVSHASDDAFWQVLELTRSPVIASHSGLRTFRNVERNVSDDMLRAIAKNGGVFHMNFGSRFSTEKSAAAFDRLKKGLAQLNEEGLEPAAKKQATRDLWAKFRAENATVEDVATQIEHAVRVAGVDHVGIGSDFDGVFATARGLEDVSDYPNLTRALLRRGLSEPDLAKIYGQNLLRVWRANLDNAGCPPASDGPIRL